MPSERCPEPCVDDDDDDDEEIYKRPCRDQDSHVSYLSLVYACSMSVQYIVSQIHAFINIASNLQTIIVVQKHSNRPLCRKR